MYYFSLETLNPTIHFIHFYILIFSPGPFNYDQRKNNLCRRIRIEKQKKEKEAGKSKKDGAILEVQHSGAPAQLAPQPQAVPSIDSGNAAAQGPAIERSDSFLEEIMDLPDIDNFDVGDADDLAFLRD